MKHLIVPIVLSLISFTAFAKEQQVLGISNTCQIRSLPRQGDGSTVEYLWKITAKTSEDRVLSVDHLTRDPKLGTRGVTRHFEYCKPGSLHEQEIILKVGQAPDEEERMFRFGGLVATDNLDVALPEAADVSVATRQIGGGDRALLVVAPRHPERWNDVAALVRSDGWSLTRRTELDGDTPPTDVLLLDSLGELAAVYGVGIGCFIGGTLVPTGGHNPLEAALHGVAISAGPSMENFREIAAAFTAHQAWQQAENATQLADIWRGWIADPERAAAIGRRGLEVIVANQGSLETTMTMLGSLIDLQNPATGAGSEKAS